MGPVLESRHTLDPAEAGLFVGACTAASFFTETKMQQATANVVANTSRVALDIQNCRAIPGRDDLLRRSRDRDPEHPAEESRGAALRPTDRVHGVRVSDRSAPVLDDAARARTSSPWRA